MRITMKHLEGLVDRLNTVTNNPLKPWEKDESGQFFANVGNYHLDGAYGGWSLYKMVNVAGGVEDVLRCGHVTKRELYNRISALLQGIELK